MNASPLNGFRLMNRVSLSNRLRLMNCLRLEESVGLSPTGVKRCVERLFFINLSSHVGLEAIDLVLSVDLTVFALMSMYPRR